MVSSLLAGCGGGSSDAEPAPLVSSSDTVQEAGAPALTGNTATDGFNWFNYRRQQAGLRAVTRNTTLDAVAQAHSDYQGLNNTITHKQDSRNPGFTGATQYDRMSAGGFRFTRFPYAYGEVISATGYTSGVYAAEDLITAIYHRFVIFEPVFMQGGSGSAIGSKGYTYFTTDFVADGLDAGLGGANFIVYPIANQENVRTNFYSDQETPDPIPDRNEVGYPISIHADIGSSVKVQLFEVRPHGGDALPVRLLTSSTDAQIEKVNSVAAIVPLAPLTAQTRYDVQFVGSVNGVPASRSWSFTTR